MAKLSKREHLIETAMGLYCRDGFRATGINKILAEAGVSRATLYKHFKSKEYLFLAALRRRDEGFRVCVQNAVDSRVRKPQDRLLVIFDVLDDWIRGKAFPGIRFSGCPLINANAEFGENTGPAHRIAAKHNKLMLDYLTGIAEQARADDPHTLARQLMLLTEGAIVTAHVSSDPDVGHRAKRIAANLINASCAAPVDA
jgi:AcrR family transcriptional regulator